MISDLDSCELLVLVLVVEVEVEVFDPLWIRG